jgi:hypothetical protein
MSMKKVSEPTTLRDILHDRSFETERAPELRDLSGVLDARIIVDPERVKSGEKVSVRLSIRNLGKSPIELAFVAHEGPMMDLAVSRPDSDERVYPPPNPPMISRPGPPYAIGLALMPEGEILHEVEWVAARYTWILDGESPTPIPLRGYDSAVRPVGPLHSGRYAIRINAMFHYAGYGIEDPVGLLEVIE